MLQLLSRKPFPTPKRGVVIVEGNTSRLPRLGCRAFGSRPPGQFFTSSAAAKRVQRAVLHACDVKPRVASSSARRALFMPRVGANLQSKGWRNFAAQDSLLAAMERALPREARPVRVVGTPGDAMDACAQVALWHGADVLLTPNGAHFVKTTTIKPQHSCRLLMLLAAAGVPAGCRTVLLAATDHHRPSGSCLGVSVAGQRAVSRAAEHPRRGRAVGDGGLHWPGAHHALGAGRVHHTTADARTLGARLTVGRADLIECAGCCVLAPLCGQAPPAAALGAPAAEPRARALRGGAWRGRVRSERDLPPTVPRPQHDPRGCRRAAARAHAGARARGGGLRRRAALDQPVRQDVRRVHPTAARTTRREPTGHAARSAEC